MNVGNVIGPPHSVHREAVLAGAGLALLGLLFVWFKHRGSAGTTSLAADTGAAGYSYPMPNAGGLNTAPMDNSASTALFDQNQEILRLLSSAPTAPTGDPLAPYPNTPTSGPDPAPVPAGPSPNIPPQVTPTSSAYHPAPTPDPAALSGAITAVGGGVPQAQRTNTGSLRAFTTFDPNAQQTLRSGGEVVGGNNLVYKMVIGSDGTPHATSLGTVGQVI